MREVDCPVPGWFIDVLFVALLKRVVESLVVELDVIPSPRGVFSKKWSGLVAAFDFLICS